MSYRIRRKCISRLFTVNGQKCKVFLEPWHEYEPGFWVWNVGFCVGYNRRSINDWYNRRKNKRAKKLNTQINGKSGIKTIKRGFEEVLKLRWHIAPGDYLVIDCSSSKPKTQFKAFSYWAKRRSEWQINEKQQEYYWFRPPYKTDPLFNLSSYYKIKPLIPSDLFLNVDDNSYYQCFDLLPKVNCIPQSI
jgi:hypothetical protein